MPNISGVWDHFRKIPGQTVAKCKICSREYSYKTSISNLKKHINRKHLNVDQNVFNDSRRVENSPTSVSVVEQDIEKNSDDEQNCYTEIVYLEDEENTENNKRKSDRTGAIRSGEELRSTTPVISYDEVEIFGKYVASLLKQFPKDLCTQLQMDIINLIMNTKLNKMRPADITSSPKYVTTMPNLQ